MYANYTEVLPYGVREWMNDAFIKRFIVYCCTPKALYNHVCGGGGGGSLLNLHQCAASTWMIWRLPQDNGAGALTTHQLQVERRESHRDNQVDLKKGLNTEFWNRFLHVNSEMWITDTSHFFLHFSVNVLTFPLMNYTLFSRFGRFEHS